MTRKNFWIQISVFILLITLILFDFETCDIDATTTHKHTHTPGRAATCLTPQTCTDCGEVLNGENGHAWSAWDEDAIEATCIHPSYDTRYCTSEDCNENEKRTGTHHALGHDLPGAIAATCTVTGLAGYGHCPRCDLDFAGEIIPIDPEDHDFYGMPVITPATCAETGTEAIPCGYGCGAEHVTPIEKLPHTFTLWQETTAPACTAAAIDTEKCKDCPALGTITGTGQAALGHDHGTSGTGSLICKRENCDHQYVIGDIGPAGGIIFYVAASGFSVQGYTGATGSFDAYTAYYMEAAPENEPSSQWAVYGLGLIADITTSGTDNVSAMAVSFGVGRKDTQTIVNSPQFIEAELTDMAAQRCANKSLNGYTDWFLPSLGELNEFYKLKGQAGVPQTGHVWSSTQRQNAVGAWTQNFLDGTQHDTNKHSSRVVRAIRAF